MLTGIPIVASRNVRADDVLIVDGRIIVANMDRFLVRMWGAQVRKEALADLAALVREVEIRWFGSAA